MTHRTPFFFNIKLLTFFVNLTPDTFAGLVADASRSQMQETSVRLLKDMTRINALFLFFIFHFLSLFDTEISFLHFSTRKTDRDSSLPEIFISLIRYKERPKNGFLEHLANLSYHWAVKLSLWLVETRYWNTSPTFE